MLLFLNHVKKISVSVIKENGELVREYEVTSCLDEVDEKQRNKFSSLIKKYKDKPTGEIPWSENTYPMIIRDSNDIEEKWLVNQSCGVHCEDNDYEVPNGRPRCLFPRGGVAALVSSSRLSTIQDQPRFVAYCFLPLPCYTSLPVHVNGHFALDPSRRNLWQDENPNEPLTRWNNFMKSRVLAPGYASLILEAQNYMPFHERVPNKTQRYFPSETTADLGLHWYHNLFPNLSTVDSAWEILAVHVYRFLERSRAQVLPVVVADEVSKGRDPTKATHKIRCWLSAQEGFFVEKSEIQEDLRKLLLRIHFPLVYTPQLICHNFQAAEVASRLVNPKDVMDFLRTFRFPNSSCEIGKLPCKLEDTKLRSIPELTELIRYCKKEEKFGSLLKGLPLLFTADGQLRIFDANNPAYCSQFSDLFPNRAHLFVHPRFVYEMNSQNEGVSQVVRKFTVNALASFMPDIFPPSMSGVIKHVPWVFPKNGALSIEWFKRLWDYLQNYAKPEQNEEQVSLEALGEWPVIPTTCGKLVTVDNAKTVLDLTESGTEIAREKKIRKFLEQLKCPALNTDITFKKPNKIAPFPRLSPSNHTQNRAILDVHYVPETRASKMLLQRKMAVTDPYVAHPHSVADVLVVLNYMRNAKVLDVSVLSDKEIQEILLFFQDEYENLEPKDMYDKLLKDMPFYKTIDGTHVSLSAFSSYAMVPKGVPLIGITRLQSHTECLFLHSDALPALDMLYKNLGADTERTVSEFYIEFILPFFYVFSKDTQMRFLVHIKDAVLPILHHKEAFLRSLEKTCCIPDPQGNLHSAKEFYDPRNEVFWIMFAELPSHFPPSPFTDDEWLDFLILIGLQTDVSEEQFLKFCRKVARMADESRNDKLNLERSKVLVCYFLTNDHLHNPSFVSSVSDIKFIAPEKVEADLLNLHSQYQCQGEEQPPFIQFCSSVPWEKRALVWTSAPLLPKWAQPKARISRKRKLGDLLRVHEVPTEDNVVRHLQNISTTLARRMKEGSLVEFDKIKNIMVLIYDFLSRKIKCTGKELTVQCTKVCEKIGRNLQSFPCVFIEESQILVKGEQLSFTLPGENKLNPFLYTVPREYGSYQHFLKRIGATETVTPLQLVNVLMAMKDQCKENEMTSEYQQKAGIAMFLLFELIVDNHREMMTSWSSELYLPSEDKFLIKSNELVSKVPPRRVQTVVNLNCHVLLSMDTCGLSRERENDYLNALPPNLRPIPLECLAREELDPSCKNNICSSSRHGPICNFMKRYLDIMISEEFQKGIVRLMKYQKKSNELPDEMIEQSLRFRWINTARAEIKCMNIIKIHLVHRKTEKVLEGSSMEHICHVITSNKSWSLYVQHEFGGKNIRGVLSKCVNKIMDCCLEDQYLSVLTDMLSCHLPTEIPDVLDTYDVDKDSSDGKIASITKNLKKDIEMLKKAKQIVSGQEMEVFEKVTDRTSQQLIPCNRPSFAGPSTGGKTGHRLIRVIYLPPVDGYTTPNRDEARRWMKQSRIDLMAAEFLLSANPPFSALVCFLSHQIVEKSLKAALYAKYGLTHEQLHTHNVHQLAVDVTSRMEITGNIGRLAQRVAGYYLNTRYPNRQPDGRVPAEQFNELEARTAVEATNELVKIVETFFIE